MCIKPIKTAVDLSQAFKKLDQLWNFPVGTTEADLFEVYALLVEDFQKRLCTDDFPDPVEAIQFFMRERGYTLKQLSFLLGCSEKAQAILNKQQALTTEAIWRLVSVWGMAPASLIKPYGLEKSPSTSDHYSILDSHI